MPTPHPGYSLLGFRVPREPSRGRSVYQNFGAPTYCRVSAPSVAPSKCLNQAPGSRARAMSLPLALASTCAAKRDSMAAANHDFPGKCLHPAHGSRACARGRFRFRSLPSVPLRVGASVSAPGAWVTRVRAMSLPLALARRCSTQRESMATANNEDGRGARGVGLAPLVASASLRANTRCHLVLFGRPPFRVANLRAAKSRPVPCAVDRPPPCVADLAGKGFISWNSVILLYRAAKSRPVACAVDRRPRVLRRARGSGV
jgi:hypothetical protein